MHGESPRTEVVVIHDIVIDVCIRINSFFWCETFLFFFLDKVSILTKRKTEQKHRGMPQRRKHTAGLGDRPPTYQQKRTAKTKQAQKRTVPPTKLNKQSYLKIASEKPQDWWNHLLEGERTKPEKEFTRLQTIKTIS